mmetsp:Transcript_118277/g.339385  ORF Transcript_118277/g.339385 Transcript_118277/m.339385 type:complete len:212 (+) Transcript_118277:413-1048(+)
MGADVDAPVEVVAALSPQPAVSARGSTNRRARGRTSTVTNEAFATLAPCAGTKTCTVVSVCPQAYECEANKSPPRSSRAPGTRATISAGDGTCRAASRAARRLRIRSTSPATWLFSASASAAACRSARAARNEASGRPSRSSSNAACARRYKAFTCFGFTAKAMSAAACASLYFGGTSMRKTAARFACNVHTKDKEWSFAGALPSKLTASA